MSCGDLIKKAKEHINGWEMNAIDLQLMFELIAELEHIQTHIIDARNQGEPIDGWNMLPHILYDGAHIGQLHIGGHCHD